MNYLLDLCSTTGPTVLESLPSPEATIHGWSKRINAPGKLVFSLNRNNPAATDENLRMWRHIRLYRRPRNGTEELLPVWYGVIVSKQQVSDRIEVLCQGALKIFSKRYTAEDADFDGEGSAEAFDLLTYTESEDGPTGISEGAGGVSETMDLTLDAVQIDRAFEEFASATGAEYEIDDEGALNFVPSLGEDKSELIELIFRSDGEPGGNVLDFQVGEDGEPMANKVIGTSTKSGGLTYTYEHPTSSDTYPVLVERKAFNQANNIGTLQALTDAYGLQRAFPVPDFRAIPATETKKFNPLTGQREMSGLSYEDVSVGDLVLVTVVTPNRNESVVKRIAELIVDVDENLNERLKFTLTEAGIFVTENYLAENELPSLRRRIQELEASL